LRLNSLHLADTPILGQINLTVKSAETVALVGPSGVGKTSLLRIISGLENRYVGDCTVTGHVAMVFQEPTLLPWRTALENLTIPTGITAAQASIALNDVGLTGREGDYPAQLSLGQQRRLSLARAFAVKPDLLLMDEPFVSLDPELVEEMSALFNTLREAHGVATILVTHIEAEAARLTERTVRLGGTPAQIISDTALST
jgi:NitT/TauT family transport system ATP-binding protein